LNKALDSSWLDLTGLKAYYKLDDTPPVGAGGTATDSGPGAFNMSVTTVGALLGTTGVVGGAFEFAGADDTVQKLDVAQDFYITGTLTMMAWIRPSALNIIGTIFTKGGTAATNNFNYNLSQGTNVGGQEGRLDFNFYDGGGWQTWYSSSNCLSVGTWTHVAVTHTFGAGAATKLYCDGVSVAVNTPGAPNNSPTAASNNEPVRIGSDNIPAGSATDEAFAGAVDEISIWTRVLSAAEINTVYQRQKP
jgi:hypothetical protein